MCVPKSITQVESMATTALHYVLTDLRRTFHVQDTGLTFIPYNQLSQYLLTIAFTPYLFAHGKVPKPVKLLTWIGDSAAYEVFAIVVCGEIQRHFLNQAHQVLPWDLFVFRKCRFIEPFYLFISIYCSYLFCCHGYTIVIFQSNNEGSELKFITTLKQHSIVFIPIPG